MHQMTELKSHPECCMQAMCLHTSNFTGFQSLKLPKAISCWLLQMDKNKGQADLSLTQLSTGSKVSSATASTAPPGTHLLGRVGSTAGGVVHVYVGRRTYGRVAMTDLHDAWVPNALEGIEEGLFVRCCVLGMAPEHGKGNEGKGQGTELQLSLQNSKGGKWAGQQTVKKTSSSSKDKVAAVTTVTKLKEGDKVHTEFHSFVFVHTTHATCTQN